MSSRGSGSGLPFQSEGRARGSVLGRRWRERDGSRAVGKPDNTTLSHVVGADFCRLEKVAWSPRSRLQTALLRLNGPSIAKLLAQCRVWPSNEMVHSYGLAKSGPYSTFNMSRCRPAVAVSRPTPRLLRHRHPTSRDENHRAALPLRGGDFSLPRSEFRTAEASREKRQGMAGSCCKSRAETAPARFRSHLARSQLVKGCSYSGRSSDTARTHDWPSNWNLSAE